MGERGRGSKQVESVDLVVKQLPSPPKGMTRAARTIWKRTVSSYPAGHFKPPHFGILRAYCEADALNKQAMTELAKQPLVITQDNTVQKVNGLFQVFQNSASTMAMLGTKLGITVNSTAIKKGKLDKPGTKENRRKGLIFGE